MVLVVVNTLTSWALQPYAVCLLSSRNIKFHYFSNLLSPFNMFSKLPHVLYTTQWKPACRRYFIFVVCFCSYLVNNAGFGCFSILECVTMEQVKQVFEVNFFGVVRLIQAVLPGMKARQGGYIVNVSSMAGEIGVPFNGIYSASKFALGGLTESLAPVLRQFNIK